MPFRAALLALMALLVVAAPADGAAGWRWPVAGQVITAYRNGGDPYAGGKHRGIDIGAPVGTPVAAAAGGTVRFAGTAGSSGQTVSVRTDDGRYDTSYLHLSAIAVRRGQHLGAGERVGAVGTTGRRSAAAPHLHFGVRDAGTRHGYHDPMDFLPAPPGPGQAPRPVPVPVTAPRPVAVAPRPVSVPRPVGAPLRRPARVPAGRRVRVPDAQPVSRPALRPVGAPAPGAVPARRPQHVRAPRLGPRAAPAPARVPQRVPAPVPAARPGHPSTAPSPGPDLGLALACVGVLAAAACVGLKGGRPDGRTRTGGRAAGLRAALAPLTGRR
jgi:Peptidase family M23